MALTIFLCGHGSWNPKDGFFELPPWVTMSFVVDFAKVLYTTDMYKVCEGNFTREYARTIGETGFARSCPNMTWTSDDPAKIQICDDALKLNKAVQPAQVLFPNNIPNFLDGNKSIKLSKFFSDYWEPVSFNLGLQFATTHFVWNCCAYADLKPSKLGGEIGLNAAHGSSSFDHIDYTGPTLLLVGKSKLG